MKANTTECINWCNKLLRGERSAVETYESAIKKHADKAEVGELQRICDEHREAVRLLEQNVRQMGGEPDTDSGAWGLFANAVQSAANLFGEESAIQNLQNGEKVGKDDYEDALESEELMPDCRELYANTLLPRTREHIETLERLEEAAS